NGDPVAQPRHLANHDLDCPRRPRLQAFRPVSGGGPLGPHRAGAGPDTSIGSAGARCGDVHRQGGKMNRAIAWALLLAPAAVGAQGTAVDYQRSDSLRTRLQGLVVDAPGPPTWIGTSDHFWYRKSVAGGNAFELVDATTLEKRPAFDHAKIATALSAATAKTYTAITLPF